MTYVDPHVVAYVAAHFVAVKLDLSTVAEAAQARELVPLWTPTVVVTDARGREVHREIGYLPPAEFWPRLGLGRAKGLLATARGAEAVRALDEALAQCPTDDLLAELLYWRGAIGYSVRHETTELTEHWGRLRHQFPTSTWSTRASFAE